MNIYVGNLPREATEDELRDVFAAYGQVASVTILKDKFSGESRGFGFVEMPAKAEAQAAITGLNGHEMKGRTLTVNEARGKKEKTMGGGGRGRGPMGGGRGGPGGGSRRPGGGGRRSW